MTMQMAKDTPTTNSDSDWGETGVVDSALVNVSARHLSSRTDCGPDESANPHHRAIGASIRNFPLYNPYGDGEIENLLPPEMEARLKAEEEAEQAERDRKEALRVRAAARASHERQEMIRACAWGISESSSDSTTARYLRKWAQLVREAGAWACQVSSHHAQDDLRICALSTGPIILCADCRAKRPDCSPEPGPVRQSFIAFMAGKRRPAFLYDCDKCGDSFQLDRRANDAAKARGLLCPRCRKQLARA